MGDMRVTQTVTINGDDGSAPTLGDLRELVTRQLKDWPESARLSVTHRTGDPRDQRDRGSWQIRVCQ